jgi:hypothetical protein
LALVADTPQELTLAFRHVLETPDDPACIERAARAKAYAGTLSWERIANLFLRGYDAGRN